ncbi:MAG: efflux RND transporter permease subunit [Myxococcales bacterium FL481]|nr:MAG: efflux RND transporter permease subunit [Myxococcales bacterium FL481]
MSASSEGNGVLRLAIARPVTVMVGVILVVLFGVLSSSKLPIQLTPDISVPTLSVSTRWPGAAPVEIESEILEEQEDALKSVPGLVSMRAEAFPDRGQITLEFEVGVALEEALVRVSNRLGQVPAYPEAAREPVVSTASNAGPPLAVITMRSPTGAPVAAYRTWVEQVILPRLERVHGVASIFHLGGQDREVHVDFDPAALAARGLTVREVAARVGAELQDVSGGDMTLGKRRYLVRTPVAPETPRELERIILGAGANGAPIRLGDVATVRPGLRKATGVAMSDDRPSMVLLLWREAGTNVLEVSQEIRDTVDALQEEFFAPEGLEIELISDQTGYINAALDLVRQNLLVGASLAIIVLLLFLRSVRASGVIAVSIPVCVLGTTLGMSLMGRTVNVVSLAGMAFAVGMVVDNSIVVLESIDTWRRRAKSAAEAAFNGVREVWGAILASTVTTAAVFVPVVSWAGEVGELLRDVAVALSFAVVTSLFVSILVIPSLAARFLKPKPSGAEDNDGAVARSGAAVRRGLTRQIAWLSASRLRAGAVVIAAVTGSVMLGSQLLPPMEYLPTGNRNLIFGILTPPPGYAVEELDRIGNQVQGAVAQRSGPSESGEARLKRSFFVGDPNQVFMGGVAEDAARVRELLPYYRGVQATVPGTFSFATQASLFATRIGGSRAVEVEVSGSDLAEILATAGKLFGTIGGQLEGAQIRPIPSLDLGAPEIHATPRRNETAQLAMGGAELGLVVDALVDGAIVGEFGREGEPKIDVVLRATDRAGRTIADPESLAAAPVATPDGSVVPLGTLARIEETIGPTRIQRIERRRAVILQVQPPMALPLETAMRIIRDQVIAPARADGTIPDSVGINLSGTAGKLTVAKAQFGDVLLLALVISFLLLAALFEDFLAPVAVLVTVPLAAAGGVAGLRLADHYLGSQPLDLMTALGFLILIGVVVNNAILVVDGALARLRDGLSLTEAVPAAVQARVRPIFMSTLTSLAGLLPLVLFPGSGSELYRGVGAVVLGGLALSTLLTIYVVPSLFTLLWWHRHGRSR